MRSRPSSHRSFIFLLLWYLCHCIGEPSVADETRRVSERQALKSFRQNVFPLLTRENGGCLECHDTPATSPLVLSGEAKGDFRRLLDGRYLDMSDGDTLLGRIASENPDLRMPKEGDPWTAEEVETLKRFLESVRDINSNTTADEEFPRALLSKYQGDAVSSAANQFITYRQLRGKIKVIFGDDWVRGDRDLFAENIALFGGADFDTRFNESRTPRASFLTGLEMLARDVAQQAYQNRTGPFANWPDQLPSPLKHEAAGTALASAIQLLYRRTLYRSATESEVDQAFRLLRGIHQLKETIAGRDGQLAFELTVRDPRLDEESRQTIEIPFRGERLEVAQRIVDQTLSSDDEDGDDRPRLGKGTLGEFRLSPDQPGQRFVLHNVGTHRNVSFSGLTLRNLDNDESFEIRANDRIVQVEGAWESKERRGIATYEDENRHKGMSYITVPLEVSEEGTYEITLQWRLDEENATNVLTEVFTASAGNYLAELASHVGRTASGDPVYYYDCGNDTMRYFELPSAFQFDEDSYIEVSNRDTIETVTVAGIELKEVGQVEKTVFIDSTEADGVDDWKKIDKIRFNAYNTKGQKLTDENKRKGELSLKYRPATQRDSGWIADRFYRVRIYYPGKSDQETRVPVVVHAKRSTPLIRVSRPSLAKADALLTLDASDSETLQQSELVYSWRQLSGPHVKGVKVAKEQLRFVVPRQRAERAAWTALCGALMRHPDFLFTRPPSLSGELPPVDRMRLQLVRTAIDLTGRPPTQAELDELAAGVPLESMVDRYLESDEFRDFYFHRIRLQLESQGTEVQDEPVRLWCYVAFHDLPFQQILTADYTVDADFEQKQRAAHHGKTGLLTMKGFIQGKPGLPHYNYSAQVSMLFLGYIYEVPPEIVEQREGITALGTTDPNSVCFSCHKVLTPLAFQRSNWMDDGSFRLTDEDGLKIDATDRGAVADYPFRGNGMEAFAGQAVRKERFIRTMINTHVNFYFARPMRHLKDERTLYKRLWDNVHEHDFKIRELIRAIVTSPEYLHSG